MNMLKMLPEIKLRGDRPPRKFVPSGKGSNVSFLHKATQLIKISREEKTEYFMSIHSMVAQVVQNKTLQSCIDGKRMAIRFIE